MYMDVYKQKHIQFTNTVAKLLATTTEPTFFQGQMSLTIVK
jgi:hypothetical protein